MSQALRPAGGRQLLGIVNGEVLSADAGPFLRGEFVGLFDDEVHDAAHVPHQSRDEAVEEFLQAAVLEVGHIDDGERERAAGYELADRLAGRLMQRDMTARPAKDVEGQAGVAAIGARRQPPPIRFDRIQNADPRRRIDTEDLLNGQLCRAGLAASGLAEERRMLLEHRGREREHHAGTPLNSVRGVSPRT
ncbi:hypothetical protein J4G48_0015145 [Bradyrhizobium barranii subsp. apii]|nr:hypothetical protein [Bradyrhizobium barranii]UPT99300.1 hypothetical protein J4G48_0015145 [Bradyrhizobium barranii subsp. apii]